MQRQLLPFLVVLCCFLPVYAEQTFFSSGTDTVTGRLNELHRTAVDLDDVRSRVARHVL